MKKKKRKEKRGSLQSYGRDAMDQLVHLKTQKISNSGPPEAATLKLWMQNF
jgi:hypothetical protein